MLPDMWLAEGGQSATGALVDHVIFTHSKSVELKKQSEETGKSVYEILNDRLEVLTADKSFPAQLTKEFHVLPYFHGNRSPRANPFLKGMISGLKLSDSIDELAILYLATIQSIAYGTKHIIEEMNKNGFQIETIFACGGGTKNPVFLREHADITGCEIVLSKEKEAVLLGSAILGAVASGNVLSVLDGMKAMNKVDKVIKPNTGKVAKYHELKYKVFHKMYNDQLEYSNIMNNI
jgi:ribulose kinase